MDKKTEALKLALEWYDSGKEDRQEFETLMRRLLAEQPAQQEPVLQDIEQYRLQMAGISTAAIGYWKEGDGIHPDYDTVALRDVAKLYAKYDELYRAQQQEPVAYIHRQGNHWEVSERCLCDDEKTRGWTEEPLYTAPPASKPHGFAGVTAWIGDATVTRIVTQVQIQHERVAGQSMKQTAQVCLDMLAAHGITGEKNGTR